MKTLKPVGYDFIYKRNAVYKSITDASMAEYTWGHLRNTVALVNELRHQLGQLFNEEA